MFSISMRSIGKTLPNARAPWRGSNSSLDCHCAKKEPGNENLSYRFLAGADWKRRVRRGPRWTVAALSRCEADGGCRTQTIEFRRTRLDGQFNGHASRIDGNPFGRGANLSATVAEHRRKNWQGRN